MSQSFEGKSVLVTGGTSGIGRACALEFARRGAHLTICGRREEEGKAVEKELKVIGAKAQYIKCDITNSDEVRNVVQRAAEAFGGLDVAVNNAGRLGVMKNILDYPEDEFMKVLEVNIKGTWLCVKNEITEMLKKGKGSIVNVASVLGIVGGHFRVSAYTASKHGVVGLTKSAALEYGPKGIRVNVVCPGSVDTDMLSEIFVGVDDIQKAREAQAKAYPLRRITTPEEVAKTILFLSSEDAAFITGAAIPVDGGWTAG